MGYGVSKDKEAMRRIQRRNRNFDIFDIFDTIDSLDSFDSFDGFVVLGEVGSARCVLAAVG